MRLDEFYGSYKKYEDQRKRAEELSGEINALAKEAIENRNDAGEIDKLFEEAQGIIRERPFLSTVLERSFQSYYEAKLFLSFVRDGSVELPEGIDVRIYLEALKRVLRDLRRYFLERMDRGEVDEARKVFESMENIFKTIEKLNEGTEDLESMIEKSREELYDYKRRREDLDLDDVWFRSSQSIRKK